jgi:ectoine hydroxylase-related dioxygenase (phytanoyl-CoA dioxygenase family)
VPFSIPAGGEPSAVGAAADEVVAWDLAPGDALAFNAYVWHGAGGNAAAARRRRGYVVRYLGDDVTYDPRPQTTADLHVAGLRPGDPLQCPQYPLLPPPADGFDSPTL